MNLSKNAGGRKDSCHPEQREEPVPSVAEGIWPADSVTLAISILISHSRAGCFTSFSSILFVATP